MTQPISPYRKGTILAPVGGSHHLHIVCNDPVFSPEHGCDCVLVVAISTVRPAPAFHDPACILEEGDHPFIRHQSFVFYGDAVVWRVPSVIDRTQSGELIPRQVMDDAVFERVLAGFETSDFLVNKVRRFFRNHCS
ncbi:hypothetical protein DN122_07275 [Salmonella enterica subsp. enterica serovar Coquilhatville]|nr:hypothetical protein [Salmonella enterica]EBV1888601.1 hypothetical protein [Salmonella enterica subsp. enterica serovar Coquilhatville]